MFVSFYFGSVLGGHPCQLNLCDRLGHFGTCGPEQVGGGRRRPHPGPGRAGTEKDRRPDTGYPLRVLGVGTEEGRGSTPGPGKVGTEEDRRPTSDLGRVGGTEKDRRPTGSVQKKTGDPLRTQGRWVQKRVGDLHRVQGVGYRRGPETHWVGTEEKRRPTPGPGRVATEEDRRLTGSVQKTTGDPLRVRVGWVQRRTGDPLRAQGG